MRVIGIVILIIALIVSVESHAILTSPTPWKTDVASTQSPCPGTDPGVAAATWTVGSTQNIVWQIVNADGAGGVTGAIDPTGGTDFTVPIPDIQGVQVNSGSKTIPFTVPDVTCTGPGGLCTIQVITSPSRFVSCATIAIQKSAAPPSDQKPGSTKELVNDKAQGGAVAATIIVPSLIFIPAVALIVLAFAGKAPAKVQSSSESLVSLIRGSDAPSNSTELSSVHILVVAALVTVLEFIWSIGLAALSSGPLPGMAIVSVLFVGGSIGLGLFANFKRTEKLYLAHMIVAVFASFFQLVTLILVLVFYSEVASKPADESAFFRPAVVLVTVMAILHLVILPMNVAAIVMSNKLRKAPAAPSVQGEGGPSGEVDYQYYDQQ